MVIIETPIFTRIIQRLIPEEEYRLFQLHLVNRPEAGKIIVGSGGLRKVRWSAGGHGKSGGIRIIYYWVVSRDTILLVYAYPKSRQDDLAPEQLQQVRKLVEKEYL
jgi:mRNA-degrading endonuclease RelE of RelBE toxin-antitoxin system